MRRTVFAAAAALAGAAAAFIPALDAQSTADPPLLSPEHLSYVGAFRLPGETMAPRTFDYGGRAATYDPKRKTLFIAGHDHHQWLAEIEIPDVRRGASLQSLAVAEFRQPLTHTTDNWARVGYGGVLGGLLMWGDTLISSVYIYYDAANAQRESHFRRASPDFSTPVPTEGPYRIANAGAGFVSGYMATVPPEWQARLGGPALTGNCCIGIISRSSLGPAVSVFDPQDLGVKSPVPATQLLAYPIERPTLGRCEDSNRSFNCATVMGGVVFPEETRSVLFFGRQPVGNYCYGTGGTDPKADCYDPSDGSKGTHGYPYAYQVWAYDALDLQAVREKRRRPWEIRPYRTWNFELPFQSANRVIRSVAWDPAGRRIFLVAAGGEGARPIVHVFTVAVAPLQ